MDAGQANLQLVWVTAAASHWDHAASIDALEAAHVGERTLVAECGRSLRLAPAIVPPIAVCRRCAAAVALHRARNSEKSARWRLWRKA
jgi:hypothetical protein